MRDSLFRAEVAAAKSTQWLGAIRVEQKRIYSWTTGVAVLLMMILIAFAILAEFDRKTRVQGMLLPAGGLIGVSAPQAGTVDELFVKEGDTVREGEPLMRIHSARNLVQGDLAMLNDRALTQRHQTLLAERLLLRRQGEQREAGLQDRLRSLLAEERQALGELESIHERVQLALSSVKRFDSLALEGYVSGAQVQQKREEHLDIRLRERSLERSLTALRRDLQNTQAELLSTETSLRTSLTLIERNLATLSQEVNENKARAGVLVRAPKDGRVAMLLTNQGQEAQMAQPLLSLIPGLTIGDEANRLEAQLFASSRATGLVLPGQRVWIRYSAFPYQQFGMARGTVVLVSQSPMTAQDMAAGRGSSLLNSASSTEPRYRITVALDRQEVNAYGTRQPLRPGMSLEADIVQQRMRVWEWILEPMLTLAAFAKAHDNKERSQLEKLK